MKPGAPKFYQNIYIISKQDVKISRVNILSLNLIRLYLINIHKPINIGLIEIVLIDNIYPGNKTSQSIIDIGIL